jgi:adenosylcobinamide-GDP ribazoletransferase
MPDEIKDQLGHEGASANTPYQQKDGSKAQKAEDQRMDGQGLVQNEAAAFPEEEPVGSNRAEPRVIKKMSAADFRKKPEPRPAQEPRPSAPKPVSRAEEPPRQAQKAAAATAPVQPKPPPMPAPKPMTHAEEQPRQAQNAPAYEPEPAAPFQPRPEPEPERPVQEEPRPEFYMAYENTYTAPEPQAKKGRVRINAVGEYAYAIKGILSFFTIFRINVGDKEIQAMNKNFYLVPIAGLLIGIIASLVGIIFTDLRAVWIAPVATLATPLILSKLLHLDGLADFGDGMVASGGREASIRALKDSGIGAGGLGIALIVIIATYTGIIGVWGAFALSAVIVTMEIFAKNAMVAAAAFGEAGTGMASLQVSMTGIPSMFVSTAVSAGVAFVGYLLMGAIVSFTVTEGMLNSEFMISALLVIAGAAASSILVGWLIAHISNKKFGFVNGDVLGATNEIAKVAILFVATIVIAFYLSPEIGDVWSGLLF